MRLSALPPCAFAIAASLCASAPAHATSPTTWVAGNGADAGTCPVTAPCKTFQYALTHTDHGGTISVLSGGSFGPVNIGNKSVTIAADGVEAMIEGHVNCTGGFSPQPTGICILGAVRVNLRGLTIKSVSSQDHSGIVFHSGGELNVEHCVISDMRDGIVFGPYSSGRTELHVLDTVVADYSSYGIDISPGPGTSVYATIDRVRVQAHSGDLPGIVMGSGGGTASAIVRDSVVRGIFVTDDGGKGSVSALLDRTASAQLTGGTGILAVGKKAKVRLNQSVVTKNKTGLDAVSGGSIESFGNNVIRDNTTDGSPTTTVGLK
jgi:hypothetical protein